MSNSEFEFRDFIGEVENMRRLAVHGKFVDSVSAERLSQYKEQIECAKLNVSPTRPGIIEIPKDLPVASTLSAGDYQPNKTEKRTIVGQIATRWMIRPLGVRKKTGYKRFIVDPSSEAATTQLRIVSGEDLVLLAEWHSDIRPVGGLGCCFHTQVLGKSDDPPFPAYLDIPRFPDPFITPMAAFEFLLGELFPERWKEFVSGTAQCVGEWRESQKRRWIENLSNVKTLVSHSESTPWVSIRT